MLDIDLSAQLRRCLPTRYQGSKAAPAHMPSVTNLSPQVRDCAVLLISIMFLLGDIMNNILEEKENVPFQVSGTKLSAEN